MKATIISLFAIILSVNVFARQTINEIIKKQVNQSDLKFEKQAQIFSFAPNKDTTLYCAEGTIIKISANSFVSKKTGKVMPGSIRFSVTEFYKLSDIALSGLSTTSNGDLLETGGMIHVTATANGVELKLKQGKSIEISFPTEQKKKDMQLFSGSWQNENLMNWTIQSPPVEYEIFTVVEQMPEFVGGDVSDYIKTNLKYPTKAKESGLQGTVYVTFVVTEEGNIVEPRVLRGVSPELDDAALAVVKNMPVWKPAKQRGKNVSVQYNLPVRFNLDGVTSADVQKRFEESYTDTTVQKENAETILYYVLSSTKLEWINCSRFINKSPSTNFIVNTGNDVEALKIIFNRYRSVIGVFPGKSVNTTFNFPAGEDITIVAIKRIDDIMHLAVKRSNTSNKIEKDLVFLPVTMEMLKTEMQKLDRISN